MSFEGCYLCKEKILLGRGSYGIIVQDNSDASKVIKCQRTDIESGFREILFYNLLNHPNIPNPDSYEIIRSEDVYFVHIIMNRLESIIYLKESDIKIDKNITLYLDILDAVAYMGSKGVYHQDIIPDNIMFDPKEKKIYLIDMGSCNDSYFVQASWTCPNVLHPNSKITKEIMIKNDAWALGLLAIYMFEDDNVYSDSYKISRIRRRGINNTIIKRLPDEIAYIVTKMLEPKISERWTALQSLWYITGNSSLYRDEEEIDINGFNNIELIPDYIEYIHTINPNITIF